TQALVAVDERTVESTAELVRSIATAQRERQRGVRQLTDDAGGENEAVRDGHDRIGAEGGREEVGRGAGQRGQRIARRRTPERGKAFVQRDAEPGPCSERSCPGVGQSRAQKAQILVEDPHAKCLGLSLPFPRRKAELSRQPRLRR